MSKFLIIMILIFNLWSECTYAVDLSDFTAEIRKYSNEYFPELNSDNLLEDITSSGEIINPTSIIKRVWKSITAEFENNISLIFKIVGVAILCSVLKNLQANFGETGISEIAFYVCYILVIILIMTSFTSIISICKDTITKLTDFMKILIPVIIGLLIATGNITTVAVLQPLLLTMISIISVLLSNLAIPAIFISTIISVISNISEHVSIKRISDLLKKTALWCLELALVIFVGVLSLEGTLSANIDGITAKTAKTVVSSAVPVVGKLLGDTVDSVMGGISITKNAIGVIGVIVILAITILPLIRTLILMFTFNLASALVEPIADGRIVNCMSGISDTIKILFAIMATTTFLFIISVTLIIKVTNFSLMYR